MFQRFEDFNLSNDRPREAFGGDGGESYFFQSNDAVRGKAVGLVYLTISSLAYLLNSLVVRYCPCTRNASLKICQWSGGSR